MTIEDHPTEIALIDRNDNLVVMGRKAYDRLHEEANTLLRERDEARVEVERLAALIAECRRCCSECSPRSECQTCQWLREGTEARR